MKAVWVTRSFLDYRIPVFSELDRRLNGEFALFYNADYVPDRCCRKVRNALGSKANGLRGEWALRWGSPNGFANRGMQLPYQPGLVKAILDEEPDVLISDGFFQWTYAALWLRMTKGIRHMMCYERTAHTERGAQWSRRTYRRLSMRWIDAICCSGNLCGQYVQSLGYPADRIAYGHMVADVDGLHKAVLDGFEKPPDELKTELKATGLVFLYVGQLIPRKGIDRLLVAWESFSANVGPDKATLLLVGDGSQREELRRYGESHCIGSVRFVGAVDYDALAPYYKTADVFVIPTLEDNWSLVVPEAMACGLPIVCSRYNGCWPEYVTPANGWVFDPLDIQDTVNCLTVCFQIRDYLRQMGRQSCQIVGHHTVKEAVEAILSAARIALDA